ncbi:MAG TPA: S8/S53 family peptidase [Polyangiaceae bacterium]|nr:S8/S53 family peptidase [Polyangiaceae bacterium]
MSIGCSSEKTEPAEHKSKTGTLSTELTGVSEQGYEYELKKGRFSVTGPTVFEWSSENFPDETFVEHRLPAGTYQQKLEDGWYLERKEKSGSKQVDATLVSENPVEAVVEGDATTEVSFRFKIGDDVVVIGKGSLVTTIEVDDGGPTSFQVTAFEPVPSKVPGLDEQGPSRPVGAFARGSGEVMEFVAEELILTDVAAADLPQLLADFGGTLLKSIEVLKGKGQYLVSIAGADVDTEQVELWLQDSDLGTLSFSSEAALRTFAAATLISQSGKASAAPNFVMHGNTMVDRSLPQSPSGSPAGYTPNPFDWPSHSRGSAQDIGVAEAWRVLYYHGLFSSSRVHVMVLDGGFRQGPDVPAETAFFRGTWDQPNPSTCSGSPCDWHGTDVLTTLAASTYGEFGSAGTGGPVVRPRLIQAPADFFQGVEYVASAIGGATSTRIVNMSGGFWIDQWICDNPFTGLFCATIQGTAAVLSAFDNLVVASAGNDGRNIGTAAFYVPCEAEGVLCVAGMRHNSRERHPDSNYSFTGSVDLWAPFEVWVGADPAVDPTANGVRRVRGTSFSAPFVAGVAALVQAADPSLDSNAIERVLMDTAHRGSGSSIAPRWVDAYAAVSEVLDGIVPPFVSIVQPTDGTTRSRTPYHTELVADVQDALAGYSVDWYSSIDGRIGGGEECSALGLSFGTHTIGVRVTSAGLIHEDSVQLTLTNDPPTVTINSPNVFDNYYTGTTLFLSGESLDPNEDGGMLTDSQVRWQLDGEELGTGHSMTLPAGTVGSGWHTVTFIGNDGDLTSGDDVTFFVAEAGLDIPPSIVKILPEDGSDLGYADKLVDGEWVMEVELIATAEDDGGTLPDSAYEWTESFTHDSTGTVTRSLGKGKSLTTSLVGLCFSVEHDVTLTVTDSAGQTAKRTHRYIVHLLC